MKKLYVLGVLGLMLTVLAAMSVSAAYSCTNAWTYNNGTDDKNVSAGNVCVNETDYDVDPTAAVYCSNNWANYTDGACSYTLFYVGYAGTGAQTCVATGWVVRTATVTIAQDYIINTTVNGLVSGNYVTNTGEVVPAKNACLNVYTTMGPSGYCDGGNALDTNRSRVHVTDGNVCVAGANADPNATVKCGTWSNCVAGASTAAEYYVGYAASGTSCSDTDWKTAGTTQTAAPGVTWRATDHLDSCSGVGYAYSYDKGDFKNIITDGMGTSGAELVSWLDLIILTMVLGFVIGIAVKFSKGM